MVEMPESELPILCMCYVRYGLKTVLPLARLLEDG